MSRRCAHSAYLSPSSDLGAFGLWDDAQRRNAARDGSARLLSALLRYYEQRRAA